MTYHVPFIIYILSAIILNMVMFGIARFYQKKLDKDAWASGFFISILFLLVAVVTSLISLPIAQNILSGSLSVAAVMTLWNCITIYFSMKQIHRK